MGGNCSSPTVVVLHSYSATMDRGKQDKRSIGHPNIHLKLRNSISTDRPSDPLDQGALPKTPSELSRGGRTGSAKNWAFKVLRRGRVRFSRAAMFPR